MPLPRKIADDIRARKPFMTPQLMGYWTGGGTYIVASTPLVSDDDSAHDLVAILPDDSVAQLRITANMPLFEAVMKGGE